MLRAESADLFEMRVRPLLAAKCFACHTDARMGELQLDTREHFLKGGKSGAVVVPGHPEKSLLLHALQYSDDRLKMPPSGKLKDDEIEAVSSWIASGAVWPENVKIAAASEYVITAKQRAFWAFQPVQAPKVPQVRNRKWASSDIDRFVLARLEEKSLGPVRSASKRTLIRRATFDLSGLPPTPEEVTAFEQDKSAGAFAKVVDRLLASPRYGERWGRIWLDVARYSDDRLNSERDDPYENSFRYRDWVIQAFQDDMPFDVFVKAQIAGDLIPNPEKYQAGLGFYAMSPEMQDDRVDATTRGFLGLTVACAQCHNHKYDPIPTRDYYSLLGIFRNTEIHEIPLAAKDVVDKYDGQKKKIEKQETAIADFVKAQGQQLAEVLASRTAKYMLAAAGVGGQAGPKLDAETLTRVTKYLDDPKKNHPYLKPWLAERAREADAGTLTKTAEAFESLLLAANAEKKRIDDENHIRLGLNPSREDLSKANLVSMDRDKFVLWEDLFGAKGVYRYGDAQIDRFLSAEFQEYLGGMRSQLASLKKELPPQYPFLHAIRDKEKLAEQHVWIRGSEDAPGEPAPPHFLTILSPSQPPKFTRGAGRLELAEAVVSKSNPLTARVIVNRVWQQHFGHGIVRTASNFGAQGEPPSNPELLDYLARRFMAEGWSIKKLHRELMLTSVYALSSDNAEANFAQDPEDRLFWRFDRHRLDAESMRDSLLFVSGKLDEKREGPAVAFTKDNYRRTVYGAVSRRRLDPMLALFDFPNPNSTSERRLQTTVPLQKLFLMNSDFVMEQSQALTHRIESKAPSEDARIREAYRIVFQREPTPQERQMGAEFLKHSPWPEYAQVLLSSNEFGYVN